MRKDVYYQRGAPDPILGESIVLEIVRQHVPGAKTLRAIDESGGEARTYAVDSDIILKVQRPQQLRRSTSLAKEALFLRQLQKRTDVSVPRVHGYGRFEGVEYLCMSRMPGVAAERVKLTSQEKTALLLELGSELRKIHDMDQKPLAESGLFPCDDPPDLAERLLLRYQSAIRRKKDEFSPDSVEAALREAEITAQRIRDAGEFTALHANPYIPHVFVDEGTHRYSGIIDFGDAYIGHPIFDMWYWKAASRNILLSGYTSEKPVSAAFRHIFDTLNAMSRIVEGLC